MLTGLAAGGGPRAGLAPIRKAHAAYRREERLFVEGDEAGEVFKLIRDGKAIAEANAGVIALLDRASAERIAETA